MYVCLLIPSWIFGQSLFALAWLSNFHHTCCSNWVSRHWDAEVNRLCLNSREDEPQTLSSCLCFVTPPSNTVLHISYKCKYWYLVYYRVHTQCHALTDILHEYTLNMKILKIQNVSTNVHVHACKSHPKASEGISSGPMPGFVRQVKAWCTV